MSLKDERLTQRTCKIIKRGRKIVLKKNGWYLHHWSNIAAGPDEAHWGTRHVALEIFNLKWAFALAKLYECKVFTLPL